MIHYQRECLRELFSFVLKLLTFQTPRLQVEGSAITFVYKCTSKSNCNFPIKWLLLFPAEVFAFLPEASCRCVDFSGALCSKLDYRDTPFSRQIKHQPVDGLLESIGKVWSGKGFGVGVTMNSGWLEKSCTAYWCQWMHRCWAKGEKGARCLSGGTTQ